MREMTSDNLGTAHVAGGAAHAITAAQFIAPKTDTTLSESLIVLRNRRMAIIVTMMAGILVGLYQSLTQPKIYEASGRIQVRTGASNEYKLSTAAALGDDPQRKMMTEVAILTSDSLLVTVARDLNLPNNKTFLGSKEPVSGRSLDDPTVRQGTIRKMKANLTVTLVPKTDIILIRYGSLSAKLSADVVNKVIEDYIHRSYETRYESTETISRFLSGQLDDLKQQVESSQNQMMDLQKQLGVLGFDSTHNQISTSLDDLAKAQGEAKLARILAESRYQLLMGMDPNAISSSLENGQSVQQSALMTLRTQLATAKANLAELTANLGPNHPSVKSATADVNELQKQVNAEQMRLLSQARESYLLARQNEEQTTAALEQQKADAYKLRDALVQYTILQRTFESNRTLYEELMQRLRTAGIQAGLESLEIDIVDRATPPATPTMTPRSTLVLTWTAIGLVAGVLLAFLLESLDTGLRSIAEIESVTELPSLAIIPRAKRSSPEQIAAMSTVERNISVLTQPKSQFTEAFRSLRTALLLSTVGREPRYILFTSATPSEGKTTTASNLAVILSQRGTRVLLIDADLRRPNVHHRFGLNGKLGLSTVLSGQTTLEDSVQQVREVPGLDILASGPVPPFPTEMLSSETMTEVLRHAGELYTHVIIDSPPILSVTDGVLLSRQVDVVVMVVRHAKSSKHIVRRGRDLLIRSGAPLAGIVLNAVDLNAPEYYGYYGYTGYSYSSLDPAGWDAQNGSSKSGQKKKDKR
jgi:capsular exopolysaccharide synthesis family protein